MTKNGKAEIIAELAEKFGATSVFYLTDSSTLTVEAINNLRRECFSKGVQVKVAKNTLIKRALESATADGGSTYEGLYDVLKGPTTIIFSEVSNLPAKIIKEFRKSNEKPVLKAAFIDNEVYIGDEQLEFLSSLKSKDELIADVLALLQSPAKNVVSALQSSGGKLAGILKTLSEREEA